MHARNRTWLLGSDPVERCRHRTGLIDSPDGSTLSLDFTTGVLDPRLTFTRGTNATFINSQGYVEWANSNMYWNTAFEGLSGSNPSLTSSGWGYAIATGGTAVFNGDGSVTVTTTAAERRAIVRSSGFSGGGLRVVASVDVTIASGSLQASQVIVTGTPTNAQHYVNGVAWNSLHPLWNGGILPVGTQFNIAYATDSVTSGTTNMYFGVGCSSVIAGSATFSNPRWTMWKGSGTVPYYPNTSATNNSTANYFKSNDYQAPRFDYDPTTLQPRGLLIEGSSDNTVRNSNDIYTTGFWGNSVGITATQDTSIADPSGGTQTCKIVKAAGTQFVVRNQIVPTVTVPAGSTVNVTASIWMRMNGAGQAAATLGIFDGGGTVFGTRNGVYVSNPAVTASSGSGADVDFTFGSVTGWVRVGVTRSITNSTGSPVSYANLGFYIYPDRNSTTTATIFVWGAQFEIGAGVSSLIPTGASTGSRAFDSCVMDNITSLQYSTTNGSMYYEGRFSQLNTSSFPWRMGFTNEPAPDQRTFGFLTNSGGSSVEAKGPGGTPTANVGTPIALNTDYKLAWSVDTALATGEVRRSSNGGAVSVSGATAMTVTGTPTYFMFGQKGYGAFFPAGTIKAAKYWPTTLSDAQLQAITT